MVSASPSRTAPRTRQAGWLTASVVLGGWLAVGPAAHADTIPEWNLITAETLQTAQAGTGLAHSRVYAMVHGAMFDAVNAVKRRYHPYAADLEAAAGASPDAAATTAAHAVLVELYPLHQTTLKPRARRRWPEFRTVRPRPMALRSARQRHGRCWRGVATTG